MKLSMEHCIDEGFYIALSETEELSHNFDMGDLQTSLSPYSFSTSSSSSLGPQPLQIDSEIWQMAERRTQEILYTIQPTLASEQKRKEVIHYIQRLIRDYFAVEVFPFGSVPLKTYLPDGDIDLTTLSHQSVEDDLAKDVCTILQHEEQDPELQVNDVQYIQAQVKLVKCSVKNISVDISFNQMAGPSALYFLEQVDQLIGRDHLFKRSIMLIKAWCFYESRILGAHHGLISTYALQILVLNIINMFHSSLPGPLAVLYKFLEYYSTFDWDNYCVTVNGSIPIPSFQQMESTDHNRNEFLLTQEFLRNLIEMLGVPMNELQNGALEFPFKHLNIVDPLKSSNNLGRSVSKGNFHRIRCALAYGAQRLGEILVLPGQAMGGRLEKFFMNTLDRNGRGQRPDAEVPVPAFGTGRSEASALIGDYDKYFSGPLHGQWSQNHALPLPPQASSPSSPSQIKQRSAGDVTAQLSQSNQKVCSQRGTDVFFPRQKCHPYASELLAAASGVDTTRKSRGTGTYIPDMSYNRYKDLLLWMRTSNHDSAHRSLLKSPRKVEQDEDFQMTDKSWNCNCLDTSQVTEKYENDSRVDLSLAHFPLLPCSKNSMSSEIHPSYQTITEASQAKDCSGPTGNIRFGTIQRSPLPPTLPSLVAREQGDSGVSFSIDRMPTAPRIETQKQQEFFGDTEKITGFLDKPYQVKNDTDFPTL